MQFNVGKRSLPLVRSLAVIAAARFSTDVKTETAKWAQLVYTAGVSAN